MFPHQCFIWRKVSYLYLLLIVCGCKADELPQFNLEHWPLFPVGEFSATVLRCFVIFRPSGSTTDVFKAGIREGRKFFVTVLKYLFEVQTPIAVITIVGIVIGFVLIFSPYCMYVFRTRQFRNQNAGPLSESSRRLWLVFLTFVILCGVALFGAFLLCIASFQIKLAVHEMFRFANYSLDVSFTMAQILGRNYLYKVGDISNSVADSVTALSRVNKEVGEGNMNRIMDKMKPVQQIVQSINWDILRIKTQLDFQMSSLVNLANNTATDVENRRQTYIQCLKDLKKVANHEEESVIDRLLKIELFGVSNVADSYETAIAILTNLSRLSVQSNLHRFNEELLQLSTKSFYDPSQLKHDLQQYAYRTEHNIGSKVEHFLSIIGEHVTEENRQFLKIIIEYIRKDMKPSVVSVATMMFLFGVVSIALSSVKIVGFLIALIGTKGFKTDSSDPQRRCIQSSLSNFGGGLLLFSCYAILCVLWLYWTFGVLLFFISTLPNLLCQSTKDLAILDITIDHPSIRKQCGWFYMFSSTEFNTTMKQNIENCQRDVSYFASLPDTMVDMSVAEELKFSLNLTEARLSFEDQIQNITTFNVTETIDIEDFTDILDQVNNHSFFVSLKAYIKKLTKAYMELSDIMEESDSAISEKAVLCTNILDSFIGNLSRVLNLEKNFKLSIKRLNVTLKTALKQIDYLQSFSDKFYAIALNNSGHHYETILITYLSTQIDGIFFDLAVAFKQFRASISLCRVLNILQTKSVEVFCYNLFVPIALSWLGFAFISFFQLLNVLLVIPCCRMFEFAAKDYKTTADRVNSVTSQTENNPSSEEIEKEIEAEHDPV